MRFLYFLLIFFTFSSLSASVYAQQSMVEAEKMRLQEEKNRHKAFKKAQKAEKKSKKGKKGKDDELWTGAKKSKKSKNIYDQVPKASQKLSREYRNRQKRSLRHRKGNKGVTKAAKNRRKFEKKRRRALGS